MQNFAPATFSVEQFGQITLRRRPLPWVRRLARPGRNRNAVARDCRVEALQVRRRAQPLQDDSCRCDEFGDFGVVRVEQLGHVDAGECLVPRGSRGAPAAHRLSVQRECFRRASFQRCNAAAQRLFACRDQRTEASRGDRQVKEPARFGHVASPERRSRPAVVELGRLCKNLIRQRPRSSSSPFRNRRSPWPRWRLDRTRTGASYRPTSPCPPSRGV